MKEKDFASARPTDHARLAVPGRITRAVRRPLALVSGGECLSPPPREVGNCLRALLKYIRFDSISYCPSPSPIESGKTLLSFNKL
jgi:hypothetical protein